MPIKSQRKTLKSQILTCWKAFINNSRNSKLTPARRIALHRIRQFTNHFRILEQHKS